jgi:hypothetical protein
LITYEVIENRILLTKSSIEATNTNTPFFKSEMEDLIAENKPVKGKITDESGNPIPALIFLLKEPIKV